MTVTFPRVTHILETVGLGPDLSRVPEDILTSAQARGTAVHAAIEALVYGYYDGQIEDGWKGYVEAYQRFLAESGYAPLVAEIEVVYPAWRYMGHPDQIGWLKAERLLIDFKTGIADGVEYQLAGYAEAWNVMHPTERITAAAAIALRRNGTYRYHEIELEAARPVWFSAVTIFHARAARRAA